MAAISKFPLLALPADVVLRTIRVMDLGQLLKFSLISERCKELVKSIQIRGAFIHVSIENDINISIETGSGQISLSFYTEPNKYWGEGAYGRKKRLTPPQSVLIDEEHLTRHPSMWKKKDCTMKIWLEHLQDIFHHHKIHILRFGENSSEFDIDDIKEVFGSKNGIYIQNTGCLAFNQMILQQFFPMGDLTIMPENFQDSKIPPSLLMQNFGILSIFESGLGVPITLTDLLLINSKVMIVDSFHISPKVLNKFIKLWQKGSNLQIEYFCIHYLNGEVDDEQIVMKGIKHEAITFNRVRSFKTAELEDPIPVYGGMDIYRKDGVKATLTYHMSHDFSFWQMYVWFDHCVVE